MNSQAIKLFLALIIASVAAYVCGSLFSTQFVLGDLAALGAPVTLEKRISSSFTDLVGMRTYFIVIMLAFLIAFPVAKLIKIPLSSLALVAYPIAGAVAIYTSLSLMEHRFDTMPISGARSSLGLAMQVLAGVIGGFVFEYARPKK